MTNDFNFDKDKALAADYDRAPRWFVPGYDVSHVMAATLLADRIGERGRVLVLGAGGGNELLAFSQAVPGWSFVGVDPSENMLALARRKLEAASVAERTELIRGFIADAPEGPFDAATCFLTLHFIPDDGARLEALQHIRRRLAPGAPFLMINLCADKSSPAVERQLRCYGAFARRSGAPEAVAMSAPQAVRDNLPAVSPAREEALLGEAGFGDVELFYVGLTFRGWIASAC